MKKVIIFGVNNLVARRNIEYFLDDHYEIVGYSDGHYSCDLLEGKNFIQPELLSSQEYDFIVLTPQSASAQTEIRRLLAALRVPPEKVIRPVILKPGDNTKTFPDLLPWIELHYQGEAGLIFGLSYSLTGVNEKDLDAPFFNCSYSSLDIYYNYAIFHYMRTHALFSRLNKILFVMPYYYFDYDLSMTESGYTIGAMFSIRKLNDWHHYQKLSIGPEYVENYRMFGEKLSRFYHPPAWKRRTSHVCDTAKNGYMLEPLWFTEHEATVQENRMLFTQFIQEAKAALPHGGGGVNVVVPPIFLDGCNPLSKAALQRKKKKFYVILLELESVLGKIKVYDYLDAFAGQRELFGDVTHLNDEGAAEFTKLINRDIVP